MLKSWLTIFLIVVLDTSGDLWVTRGMKQIGAIHRVRLREIVRLICQALKTPSLVLGVISSALSFFLFLGLLSSADLSFALPATSLVYVCSTLGARYVLHEKVTRARWIGSALICLGVALISVS